MVKRLLRGALIGLLPEHVVDAWLGIRYVKGRTGPDRIHTGVQDPQNSVQFIGTRPSASSRPDVPASPDESTDRPANR
jgi:hypothetical protein